VSEREIDVVEEDDEDDEDDEAVYGQLEILEKLETIIALMEDLGIETLVEAQERFDQLERDVDPDA